MKSFVHEVLRRSRTSGSVLQTALCYIEAIRSKVPGLVQQEKNGLSTTTDMESAEYMIQRGDNSVLNDDCVSDSPDSSDGLLATIRIDRMENEVDALAELRIDCNTLDLRKPRASSSSLPPLSPLPSPLLCPRRTFLASLILASKFMQDRCYSNRAWAKLSGLPPREIGRCERALGAALDWRLWVGKLPAAQSGSGRLLIKSKSEGDMVDANNPRRSQPIMSRSFTRMDLSLPQRDPVFSRPISRSTGYASNTVPGYRFHQQESSMVPSRSASLVLPDTVNISPSTVSTSPSTPGLSFSPTPTESSGGDRTIQISSFLDVPTPPSSQFAAFAGVQNDKTSLALNPLCMYSRSQIVCSLANATEGGLHLPSNGLAYPLTSYASILPTWAPPEYG